MCEDIKVTEYDDTCVRMNTEDLPSWVFFPDKERAEWINSIMKQLWPYVNEYVRTTLFTTVGCEHGKIFLL